MLIVIAQPGLKYFWVKYFLLVLIGGLRHDADQVEEVVRFVSKETLEVTDESVDVSLARCLVDDVLVIIVSETSRQLLVVHLWLVLSQTPASGNLEKKENISSKFNLKALRLVDSISSDLKARCLLLTSSGSVILNSHPSPVQEMKC